MSRALNNIELDCPSDGSRGGFPCFDEDDVRNLMTPVEAFGFFVSVTHSGPAKLFAYHNDGCIETRELTGSGKVDIKLPELVPLENGSVRFELKLDADTVVAKYYFHDRKDYHFAQYECQRRQRQREDEKREEERMAELCPPPGPGETYDDLIAARKLGIAQAAAVVIDSRKSLVSKIKKIRGDAQSQGSTSSSLGATGEGLDDLCQDLRRGMGELMALITQLGYYEQQRDKKSSD